MISKRKVIISPEQLRYIRLFQDMLGVNPRDVVEDKDENRLIFVVEKGDLGRAVGRGGRKLKMMKRFLRGDLDYDIEVVEFDDNPEGFITNLLSPARVQKVKIIHQNDGITAIAYVIDEDKSIAIGRNGRRIRRAKLLAKRWYDIDNIKIATWVPSNP
ncbi:MAG: NusA-like transcription termination signal-binding factor [Candidatus Korarchaeum sp.]|nr:NusA-like transcription termination signal-binding factor [Candidatus Korarchaeum sp.]MDW8034852.1 NusA-like transcription termination signal-binding factor [Candidatus Korarchaeum sp.]